MLEGKTFTKIEKKYDDHELLFYCTDGSVYKMYHEQDCCEDVHLSEIIGDLNDLINSKIISFDEEIDSCKDCKDCYDYESYTWTFYKIQSLKGHVTLRWHGTSNGYYSESVDMVEIEPPITTDFYYRKKPLVIEAFKMTSDFWYDENSEHPEWAQTAADTGELTLEDGRVIVMTLEDRKDNIAKHVADFGDYIIRGVQGELYPCKEEIFAMTYEKVQ